MLRQRLVCFRRGTQALDKTSHSLRISNRNYHQTVMLNYQVARVAQAWVAVLRMVHKWLAVMRGVISLVANEVLRIEGRQGLVAWYEGFFFTIIFLSFCIITSMRNNFLHFHALI